MSNKVISRGEGLQVEGSAESAITPGMLLEEDATDGQLQPHGTAGGTAAKLFADADFENGIEKDDAYAADDQVKAKFLYPGSLVHAFVAAGAAAILRSDYLESASGGHLRKVIPQSVDEGGTATVNVITGNIVARATEAVDNSAGTVPVRIWAEVI